MHTRHWIFGIGLPIMGAAQALLAGMATPEELASAQTSQAQFSIWIGMAIQLGIGIIDWIKNNGKVDKTVSAAADIKVTEAGGET